MTESPLDPLLVWVAAAWLAALMLHAGQGKALDRARWLQHLAAYRVREAALAPLAVLLPTLELLCGALLLSPWRALGAGLAAALLLLYAGAMAWHLAAGRRPDCGCGGQPLALSWALVWRNLALAVLCLPAAAAVQARALTLGDMALLLAAVLLAAVLWSAFHQLLRQARRGPAF